MENAVEALKIAAAVLIFVIAITTSFNMFSKAKQTADAVVTGSDKQEYLESAELESVLYTSSSAIGTSTSGTTTSNADTSSVAGMTTAGDRIVSADDVISTIYRYYLEKYGVTLIDGNTKTKTVLAMYDSSIESYIRQYTAIMSSETGREVLDALKSQIVKNISVPRYEIYETNVTLKLEELYRCKDSGGKDTTDAPWTETDIIKRINADIGGYDYTSSDEKIRNISKTPAGKGIKDILNSASKIVEVVNEIDNSQYLADDTDGKTSLLQQYEMPTIEVVYIIY